MLNILKNTINRVFASGVDSDASAFITATGLSGTTQKSAITTLVKDLKASGLWSKMKAVYPMVTDNYNLLSYTTDLTNGYWSKNNLTITANAINSPFGNLTADKISEAATTGAHYMGSSAGVLTSTNTYTASSYFKAAERNWVYLYLYNGTSALGAYFNISSGVVGTVNGGVTASIIDAGNGWYRCSVSASVTGTGSSNAGITMAIADNNQSYTGVAGNGIYQFGFQLEQNSIASTYQPILTTPSAFMASQMKYNLKDARDLDAAFRLTWSGGWTYSATGATPNGTNAYADSKLNLLTNLPGYDSSFSVYYRQDLYGTYKIGALGATFNEGMSAHLGWTNSAGTLYNDHLGRNTIVNNVYGTFNAYHISTVTSTASQKLFRNGVLKVSGAATSGITMPSLNFYFGAANQNGTANYFDPKQIAFGTLSTGLTDTEAILLNQIVEKYQVALSRGVQAAQSFYYNSAYSNEANTYLYSTQITGTTQVSAINTLINGLKANNLWSKMKAVYPFVTDYTNLLSYTEDFSNAVYTKLNTTISINSTNAPNGTLTADKLIENTTNDQHIFFTSNTATTGQIYTFSAYLKAAEMQYGVIQIVDSSASNKRFTVLADLVNGTIVTTRSLNSPTNTSSSITSAGNGWYRVTCTMAQVGGTTCYTNVGISNSSNPTWNAVDFPSYAGTNGNGIYVWGLQCELGTSASTYQPVLGANNYQSNVAAQMKFNLVNPQDSDAAFRLAFSGGWTYSTNGAQPNGTNGYADTKLVPNTNLALNSVSFSAYSRNNFTPTTNQTLGCSSNVSNLPLLAQSFTSTKLINTYIYSYNTPDIMTTSSGLNFAGLFISTRTAANNAKVFKNNTQLASTTTQSETSQPTNNFFFGAFNGGIGVANYSNFEYAFAHIGTGLSDAEIAILNQLVTDYETTLNRNV